MNATPSTKVVHDSKGHPWLIVSRPGSNDYLAQRIEIVGGYRFQRSWQAVQFATNWPASSLADAPEVESWV